MIELKDKNIASCLIADGCHTHLEGIKGRDADNVAGQIIPESNGVREERVFMIVGRNLYLSKVVWMH